MQCPKCSAEIQDDAAPCPSCGAASAGDAPREPVRVRTSRLAIVALVLGILSVFTLGVVSLAAIVVGVAALCSMDNKGGRVTGHGLAATGIVAALIGLVIGLGPVLCSHMLHLAFRAKCVTNVWQISMEMLVYANDYEDVLPRAGGIGSVWAASTPNWRAPARRDAFGLDSDGMGGQASVSASLYLLVKYAEVTPASFVCPKEKGVSEFRMRDYLDQTGHTELIDVWDFGPEPAKHCSYAYHTPYNAYYLTVAADPGMPVLADRNPWQASPRAKGLEEWGWFDPDGTGRHVRQGNSSNHKGKGQHVMFLDGHREFVTTPNIGLKGDNIYTAWDALDISKGVPPTIGSEPADRTDSLLVHDGTGTVQK